MDLKKFLKPDWRKILITLLIIVFFTPLSAIFDAPPIRPQGIATFAAAWLLQSLYIVKYFAEISVFWSIAIPAISYSVSCFAVSFYDLSKSRNIAINPSEARLYELIYKMTEKRKEKKVKSR